MIRLPIETIYTTGVTLYAQSRATIAGLPKIWNVTLQQWDTYSAGNWADYAISISEDAGSGYFSGAYPAAIAADVVSSEIIYLQAGGAPAIIDSPASGIGQSQGTNVYSIGGESVPANNMGASAGAMKTGILAGVPTSQILPTDLTDVTDDVYVGRILIMTSGTDIRQVAYIQAYDGTTKTITLSSAFTGTPSASDTFIIV